MLVMRQLRGGAVYPQVKTKLPATVYALGLTSLLNDAASDMIYPLLPLFLATSARRRGGGAGDDRGGGRDDGGAAEDRLRLRLGSHATGASRSWWPATRWRRLARPFLAFASSAGGGAGRAPGRPLRQGHALQPARRPDRRRGAAGRSRARLRPARGHGPRWGGGRPAGGVRAAAAGVRPAHRVPGVDGAGAGGLPGGGLGGARVAPAPGLGGHRGGDRAAAGRGAGPSSTVGGHAPSAAPVAPAVRRIPGGGDCVLAGRVGRRLPGAAGARAGLLGRGAARCCGPCTTA